MADVEAAAAQLAELELLCSMYPGEEELLLPDPAALADLRDFVEGRSDSAPRSRPHFLITLQVDTVPVTLSCSYVSKYPAVLPEVSVRCPELSRAQQTQLHSDLFGFLQENCCGEVCVLSILDWLKENVPRYADRGSSAPAPRIEDCSTPLQQTFSRLWIYSHHIYNKSKRKDILDWAKELQLSGFSMPGKPGVVCVEGLQPLCDEFWARVKCLTWKKIMVRHREDVCVETPDCVDVLRKFDWFEEAVFDPHGTRGNHMDLGQLYQFLSQRGCGDIFQMYFGIEGK
ncbi:RWD domain-containing protein 2B isoform X2 [Denticeps clupeoides]|uniref:RWD domain-containing protein n=1 Tax=Denticeps clupeoides TaxID=299321 RepID=A0AAY4B8P1_9TELE|nr:RWD domain-containing protein 2B isoform X2 [Denticeps clupeoides]